MNAPTINQLLQLTRVNQKDSTEVIKNWNLIVAALADKKITSPANLIGVAATVLVETGNTFEPVKERGNQAYFLKAYWDNVDIRNQLGNIVPSDSYDFCGRGFIQLTGRGNYHKASSSIGIDLLSNPDAAMQPKVSAALLSWYWLEKDLASLCQKVDEIFGASDNTLETGRAWMNVRRAVNGGLTGWPQFLFALTQLGGVHAFTTKQKSDKLPLVKSKVSS